MSKRSKRRRDPEAAERERAAPGSEAAAGQGDAESAGPGGRRTGREAEGAGPGGSRTARQAKGAGPGGSRTARQAEAAGVGGRSAAAAGGVSRGPQGSAGRRAASGWGLGVQIAFLVAVFAVVVLVAELAGAANLGVALGVGQIAFAIAVVYLLVRR